MKWIRNTLLTLLVLAGLLVGLLGMRPNWVEPIEGVRLTPSLPYKTAEELGPDSAWDFLLKASHLPAVARKPSYDDLTSISATNWNRSVHTNLAYSLDLIQSNYVWLSKAANHPELRLPSDRNTDLFPWGSSILTLTRLARYQIFDDLQNGREKEAFLLTLNQMQVAHLFQQGGYLIEHLIAYMMNDMASLQIETLLNHAHYSDKQLEEWATTLQDLDQQAPSFAEAIRQHLLELQHLIATNPLELMANVSLHGDSDHGEWARTLMKFAPFLGSSTETMSKNFNKAYSHYIFAAEQNYTETSPTISVALDQLNNFLLYKDPIGLLAFKNGEHAYSNSAGGYIKHRVTLKASYTAIALTRYLNQNGHYPETLTQLIPDYLDTLPIDLFDQKPLRYIRRRPNHCVIYACGRDAIDNGGAFTSERKHNEKDLLLFELKPVQ